MTTRSACNLKFITSLERKRIVRIPNPIDALNGAIVTDAANGFIAANPFDETIGSLVSFIHAERVIVNEIVLV